MDGTSDEELDLFGPETASERTSIDDLLQRRRDAQRAAQEEGTLDRLAFQRRRYLQSGQHTPEALGFETLRNARPMNFGEAFSQRERQEILASVHAHVSAHAWTTQRHGAFPTRDIPVSAISVADMVADRLRVMLFPRLEAHTGIDAGLWAFRDLFVVGYHEDHQRALELHSDGCLASLTLLLNDPSEFDGGGTVFEKFDLLVRQAPGDAWIHDGKLRHGGAEITRGQRVVMVAFLDTVGGATTALAYR
ncbi:hypothetical protein IWQ56_005296 [Coemansia nantahalensis]|uniref:Uncharacterized protein n=1 Tax=Coemansia nantahalensis TaxID=2789366 RepID=A0ACC1JX69_9FUNG|nr:hypothetical protein IWQ56_005296 [Coemansia nantahalensis]KAJ2769235.1 hypothetical protein IWQ57_003191 [Coemansia nantahalensis]